MVGAIRIMLRFQAKAAVPGAGRAAPAALPGQKVAGVKLQRGLGGKNGEPPAAGRMAQLRRRVQRMGRGRIVIQQEVVVVAAGVLQLWVRRGDALPDAVRRGKIQRRTGDRGDLPGGDQLTVHRRKAGSRQLQPVVQDIPLPRQVEVGVVGQVEQGIPLLGGGGVMDNEGVLLRQAVAHLHVQPAGIALLPRRGGAGKHHDVIHVLGAPLPQPAVKAACPAVQVVFAVIGGQRVFPAVEREGGPRNAVGDPPDGAAEMR